MTMLKNINPLVALPPAVLPVSLRSKARDVAMLSAGPAIRKVRVMGSILDIFRAPNQSRPDKEGAVALIDECDMIFDPIKSELNFPVGDKVPVELATWRWQLTMVIMHGIFAAASEKGYQPPSLPERCSTWQDGIKEMRNILESGTRQLFVQMKPSMILLDKKWYADYLAVPIARWALLWLVDGDQNPLGIKHSASENDRQILVDFIAGKSKENLTPKQFINDPAKEILLQFARKWVTVLLPHCLSKRHGIDYGLLQGKHLKSWRERRIKASLNNNRLMLAVPFQGLESPSAFSEFASPDVAIGFTCLAYHNEGLRLEDVKVLTSHLRYRMLNNDHGPYRVRPTRCKFETWKQGARNWCLSVEVDDEVSRIPPLEHFQVSDDNADAFMSLYKVIKHNPASQWEYLDCYVLPIAMRFQTKKLQASGVDIGSSMLFAARVGFSGTPSNLLPLSLRDCIVQPGMRAEVVRILVNPSIVSCEPYSLSGADSSTQLLDCAGRGDFHALVDSGALITGLTNREIAYELIKRLPADRFSAVVYIDDAGAKRALWRGEDLGAPPKYLSDVCVSQEKRFTFYDQVHTTGIDIKQAIDAVCLLTIGKGMTLRDLMQGDTSYFLLNVTIT